MINTKKLGKAIFFYTVLMLMMLICIAYPKNAKALVHNSRFDGYEIANGIDVSMWQGSVDWTKVKKAGIDYVIIRIGYSDSTYGGHYTDPRYAENIVNAKAAGLKVGVYYYSTAISTSEAASEAKYVLSVLGSTKLDLPVYLDQESTDGRVPNASLSQTAMTNIAVKFCDTISAGGYQPGFYSYISWLYYNVNASVLEAKYPMWIANVTNQTYYEGVYHMWQYSFTGSVSGISGAVDRDVMYISETPSKVTGVKAKVNGNTATVTWKSLSGVAGYHIYKADGTLVDEVSSDTLSYTIAATPVETSYYVCAYCLNYGVYKQDGPASASVTVSAEVPYELSSANGINYIKLSWLPLDDASGYVVYENKGNGTFEQVGTSVTNSLKIKGLGSDEKHAYAVSAFYNTDGSTVYTEGVSTLSAKSLTFHAGTQNTKVTDIAISKNAPTAQTITWTPPEGSVDGYRVYTYNPTTGSYKKMAEVYTNSAVISNLTAGTEYIYMVRSFYYTEDTSVFSEYSILTTLSTQATKPQSFTAGSITNSSLTLSWTKGTTGKVQGYRVYSYDTSTKKYTRLTDTTATSFKITGLTQGTPYVYLVRSYYRDSTNAVVLSQYSDLLYTGTAAKKVPTFRVSANSSIYQTLTWTKPSGATVDGYRVYSYNTETKKYTRLADITATTYKVTGLTQATDYYFLVRSYYKSGGNIILSDYSTLIHTFTCYPKVTGLKASATAATSVTLKWTKTSGAMGYNVYLVNSDGSLTSLKDVTTNSATITGLTKNTSYTFMVRAYKKYDGVRYLGFNSANLTVKTTK